MKKARSIITLLCIISLVAGQSTLIMLAKPKPTQAAFSIVALQVIEIATSVAEVAQSVISAASAYSLQLKEYVLDGLVTMLAKQLLHQMTQSVVNWINSGFSGSPAFLTNPGQFFANVADQITGDFLAKSGGPLSDLCSPFNIDLRLHLALNSGRTGRDSDPYTCTLGTIINNVQNARVQTGVSVGLSPNGTTIGDIASGNILNDPNQLSVGGASIEGFMSGDFSQGGWPAFVALTTQPRNNYMGALIMSESELQQRIAAQQGQINQDLDRGKGFLSWQSCKNVVVDEVGTKEVCETQTPGSVIAGSLQKSLDAPVDELNLADEIDEIVNALIGQLVTGILQGGLHASSGSGAGDPNAVVNRILAEQNSSAGISANLTSGISTYIQVGTQYVTLRQEIFTLLVEAVGRFGPSNICIMDTGTQIETLNRTELLLSGAQAKLAQATSSLAVLTNLQTTVQTATTQAQLQTAGQQFSSMVQMHTLPSQADILNATNELRNYQESIDERKGSSAPPTSCN